ncbi:MAG: esterase-like activity of phytase family protein, partial [Vicinamibacterales bacterium]
MPPLLTWVSEFTRPAGASYPTLPDSSRFGSISGLVRDVSTNQWVGVIDDRDTRVAWLTIDVSTGKMVVTPTRMTTLTAGPGVPEAVATRADLEAIAALPDGTFLMSEEGHLTRDGVFQPGLLHVARDGLVTDVIPFPAEFEIRRDQARGVRDNRGFEGLTRTPDGRLIASLEQPLIEDGPMTSFDRGGRGRLLEFKPRRGGGGFEAGRQWWYPIDKTPRVEGFDGICDDGENGVSEVLAISNTLLLTLERACLMDPQSKQVMNPIRIFAVELGRHDVRKSLVLDLSTLTERVLSRD